MTGFLYYPEIPEGDQRVTFKANVSGVEQGTQLASVQVPFIVKENAKQ